MHPFILKNRSIISWSGTRLWWSWYGNVIVVERIVENILDPFLVCVKCVLRNHAFRIAAAARTRDSQMRVTIDTRRFSANSTNARTTGETRARIALGSVRELFFLFFFFSFFSFCEVITGVQYWRCFSRWYATTRAFLQVVQYSCISVSVAPNQEATSLNSRLNVKSVKVEDFFREIHKCNS